MNDQEKLEYLNQEYKYKKVVNVINNQDVNIVKEINIEENGSIWFSLKDVHTGGRIPVSYEDFIRFYK